ncbi:MAG: hypothetical protein NPIRA06_11290 [Nitrospirales bacterium]|nr:MAG: hypothetical protein NPIRA06_11290 [Nitrospirales bacterium]
MVLGESVIVQEGSVLIASSLCFDMKGHEWMNDDHELSSLNHPSLGSLVSQIIGVLYSQTWLLGV